MTGSLPSVRRALACLLGLLALGAIAVPLAAARPAPRVELGKPQLRPRAGIALLPVTVNGPGRIVVTGFKVRTAEATVEKAGTVRLRVAPRVNARRKLERTGRVWVSALVVFYARDGRMAVERRPILLRRHLGPRVAQGSIRPRRIA